MKWIMVMVLALSMCGVVQASDYSFGTMISSKADTLEVRAGLTADPKWEVGLFGQYYARDPSYEFGGGAYVKLAVNPDATLPVAGWFPTVGEWMDLPESIPATTYLIGKGGVMPYEEQVDLFLSVGVGASAGPFVIEYVYRMIESGDADEPMFASGPELSFGLRYPF